MNKRPASQLPDLYQPVAHRLRSSGTMQNFERLAMRAGERMVEGVIAGATQNIFQTPPNSGRSRQTRAASITKASLASGDGPVHTEFYWEKSRNKERDKIARKIIGMTSKSTVIQNATSQITGTIGRQVITNFASFLDSTEIQSVQSGVSNELGTYISSIDWSWMLINSSNIGVYVKAFYFTCSQSSDSAPNTLWTKLVDDQAAQTDMELHWNAHPYDLPDFKDFWRIDRVDNIYLAPGKHWEGNVEYRAKVFLDAGLALTTANAAIYKKGISKYILFTSYGIPTSSVVTATGVGTGEVYLGGPYHLNLVRAKKTTYSTFDIQGVPNYDVTGDLATAIANPGTTQHRIMLEDVDEAAQFDTAD